MKTIEETLIYLQDKTNDIKIEQHELLARCNGYVPYDTTVYYESLNDQSNVYEEVIKFVKS